MKKSFRFIKAHKGTSFVTISGFATGLGAAILLLIFIHHELSFDKFWPNGDRVFRMNTVINGENRKSEYPICLRKAYSQVPQEVPGIKAALQIYRTFDPEIKFNNRRFRNLHMLYVDSTFFKVFQMQTVMGDAQQALAHPDALVLTQSAARKIFGDENPVGQIVPVTDYSLTDNEQPFQVAAVVPDLPKTSHFNFDVLLPMAAVKNIDNFGGLEFYTYYILDKNVSPEVTVAEIGQSYTNILQAWIQHIGFNALPSARILPLKDIYLYSQTGNELGPGGDLKTIHIFTLLTALILIIAITNFINIFLVQGNQRALETGIRKTLGANRWQLLRHFMKDSFLLTGLSFIIALFAITLLVSPFGNLVHRTLSVSTIFHMPFFLIVAGLFLLTATLAGAYPAWYLSRQQPLRILSGTGATGKPKQFLRKNIVLAQFAICMLLLTNLFILQQQFNYMNNRPLGFDAKNVVAYRNLSPALQKSFPLIKNDLQEFPGIESVTGSHACPGQGASGQSIKRFGSTDNTTVSVREVRVQPDFFKTYGMKLQAGRSFRAAQPADRNAVILNQTAVRALGLKEPVGSRVVMFNEPMEVIGVVGDYHYSSLRYPIGPEIFTYYKDQVFAISVRIRDASSAASLEQIKEVFRKYDPDYTPDYVFLSDAFAAMYGGEHRLIRLVQAGSVLAIILTILGLASITAIVIQQRTKEIGIRKTIGASSYQIVRLLVSAQLIRLVVTTVVAGFVALWIIQQWLENYAYRVDISFWIFLLSGTVILFIAMLVTSIIGYRAATANPVDSLRYE